MAKVVGYINLHSDVSYKGLTEKRPVASVSFLGRYGIIDFVSALENDSDLNFRIDDFKMVASGENLQATFNVRNVRIKIEIPRPFTGRRRRFYVRRSAAQPYLRNKPNLRKRILWGDEFD